VPTDIFPVEGFEIAVVRRMEPNQPRPTLTPTPPTRPPTARAGHSLVAEPLGLKGWVTIIDMAKQFN